MTEAPNTVSTKHIDFEQGTLPVISVNINETAGATIEQMNASPDHSVECTGTVDLVVGEGASHDYETSQKSLANMEMEYIRGRGHSTWSFPKKAYKLKFKDKQSFFGMEKSRHWVLLANAYDSSLVRDRLVNWLARRMDMDCVMQDVPVDLVMNGEYLGSWTDAFVPFQRRGTPSLKRVLRGVWNPPVVSLSRRKEPYGRWR